MIVNGGTQTRIAGGATLLLNGEQTSINPGGLGRGSFGAPLTLPTAASEGDGGK